MATVSSTHDKRPFIDGQWESGDEVIDVTDIADSGVFTRVTPANQQQAEAALDAAADAQATLRETTVPERVSWLETIAAGLRERKTELAEVIVREAGSKPISSARSEVKSAAERFKRAVAEVRNLPSMTAPPTA